MDFEQDEIGALAQEAIEEAFNDAGIPYNNAAITKINLIIQHWADMEILADGELGIGDYE